MGSESTVTLVEGSKNKSKPPFNFDFDAILGLRLISLSLLIASTIYSFVGVHFTNTLSALCSVMVLVLAWNVVMVLLTGRFPRVWQSKLQDADGGDTEGRLAATYRYVAYQRIGPFNDAWLGAFLLMITVWAKSDPDSYSNYERYGYFNPIFVLNLAVVVFMHVIAALEHLRAHYPNRYERLVPCGRSHSSHTRLP